MSSIAENCIYIRLIKSVWNLTFHSVLTGQGISFCNRARLNFQAFAFRDMKMAAREGYRVGQKMLTKLCFR